MFDNFKVVTDMFKALDQGVFIFTSSFNFIEGFDEFIIDVT